MRSLVLLLLGLTAARAQSPPDSSAIRTVASDAAVVTATRLPVAATEAPARVTRLRPADADAAPTVADLLDARAPVVVRRYGPSGLATLSLRGAGAAQTLVLLDGVPLGSPALGVVDLSLVPSALVASAEVLSGSASGLWGSRAVGGVVALASGAEPGATARVEAGPWGERRATLALAVPAGGATLTAAAEHAASTDDYAVSDGLGGVTPRAGWDARLSSAVAGVSVARGRSSARLLAWGATAERGLGGTVVGGALVGERQWDATALLAGAASTAWGRLRIDATAGADASRLRWAAPYPAPPSRADAVDETGRTRAVHGDLRASLPLAGGVWTLGLAAGHARAAHPSLAADASDAFAALAAAGDVRVGRARLFPSLRADRYAPAGRAAQTAVSPHLGVSAHAGRGWTAKASLGRAFRMPTLNDRFWSPGGRPDLRPERAWAADAGLARAGRVAAEATVFWRTTRDEIVWAPGAGGVWSPENVARTRAVGAEASVALGLGRVRAGQARPATVGAVGTWLHARDGTTGQPLRYQPAWTARAWAQATWRALRADVGLRAVGARPTTASGSQPLPAYAVVDGSLSAVSRWGPATVTLGLAAENMLDADYASVRLHPMPPRHARVRLTVTTR